MAPRGRHRLAWILGALFTGAASGASLVASATVEPALCSSETLQATVARTAFEAWLDSGTAFRKQDTIRRVYRARRGCVVVELVRDGCPVTMVVTII